MVVELFGYMVTIDWRLYTVAGFQLWLMGFPLAMGITKDLRKAMVWPFTFVMFLIYSVFWIIGHAFKGWKD